MDPAPQAPPEHHEADRPPRTETEWHAPAVREHYQDDGGQTALEEAPAPDVDDSQDSAPTADDQPPVQADDSCGQGPVNPPHYSMDDLVSAMQNLDSSY